MPRAASPAALALTGWPSTRACPAVGTRRPDSSCAKATCPLPDTPAMATISPARKASDTPRSRSRALPAVCTSTSSATTSPTAAAGWRARRATAWPTIHSASWPSLVSAAAHSATRRPARSTATRCDTRSTSPSLWLMKMMDRPCATIWPSVSNSASLSCGVSTAVGSSRIRMRAPRYSAFRISTRWRSPTDRSPTRAAGSTVRPNRCPTDTSFSRAAARRVKGCASDSLPSMTLSSTLRLSASVKCWCTMPMPAASAARGLPGGSGAPKASMWPTSAT